MSLTDREKEDLKRLIDNNQPLPPKYKLSLFADAPEVELIWLRPAYKFSYLCLFTYL